MFTVTVCFLSSRQRKCVFYNKKALAGSGAGFCQGLCQHGSAEFMLHLQVQETAFLPLHLPVLLTLPDAVHQPLLKRTLSALTKAQQKHHTQEEVPTPTHTACLTSTCTQTHTISHAEVTVLSAQGRATSGRGQVYAAVKPSEQPFKIILHVTHTEGTQCTSAHGLQNVRSVFSLYLLHGTHMYHAVTLRKPVTSSSPLEQQKCHLSFNGLHIF